MSPNIVKIKNTQISILGIVYGVFNGEINWGEGAGGVYKNKITGEGKQSEVNNFLTFGQLEDISGEEGRDIQFIEKQTVLNQLIIHSDPVGGGGGGGNNIIYFKHSFLQFPSKKSNNTYLFGR